MQIGKLENDKLLDSMHFATPWSDSKKKVCRSQEHNKKVVELWKKVL